MSTATTVRVLKAAGAVLLLVALSSCSQTPKPVDVAAPSEQERVAVIKSKLNAIQARFLNQQAALQQLFSQEADLEQLIALLHSPDEAKQRWVHTGEGMALSSEARNLDRLQVMLANQQALKSELKNLLAQLHELEGALSASLQVEEE